MKKEQIKNIIKEEFISVLKEFDSYGGSLSQVDPSYKSNIALKWGSEVDMVDDLKTFFAGIMDANGLEALQDMRASLKEVDKYIEKLALSDIESHPKYGARYE